MDPHSHTLICKALNRIVGEKRKQRVWEREGEAHATQLSKLRCVCCYCHSIARGRCEREARPGIARAPERDRRRGR